MSTTDIVTRAGAILAGVVRLHPGDRKFMRPSSATPPRSALVAVCVCTCIASGISHADSSGIGGALTFTSNYVFRGISQSLDNPAVQADLHYRFGNGWIAGVWGSRSDVDPDDFAALEIDAYLSRHWALDEDWAVRVTLSHYAYPDDPRVYDYDYDEVIATLGYQERAFATVAWSPNATIYANGTLARDRSATSYELAVNQPLAGPVAASAGIGYYALPDTLNADYWFWNIGLSCSLGRTLLTVAYIGTDRRAEEAFGYRRAANNWTGSLAWRF